MKKVIVLGATGHTAREIITRLLEQDDVELTLFARNAKRLSGFQGERVHVVEGDARNLDDLKAAIRGQDVVISAMGGLDLGNLTEGVVQVPGNACVSAQASAPGRTQSSLQHGVIWQPTHHVIWRWEALLRREIAIRRTLSRVQ